MTRSAKELFLGKQSIFLKIYLCFLLAMVLVITAQLILDKLTETGPFKVHKEHPFDTILLAYGQSAVEHYINKDNKALLNAVEQFRQSTGVTAFIVDPEDREITGRPLPDRMVSLAARVRLGGKIEHSEGPPPFLPAAAVAGSDNKIYIVLGEMPPPQFGPDNHSRPPPGPGNLANNLAFRLLILLIVSGLVCFWFAKYLTSPVIALREATRRFASGDLKVRVGKHAGGRRDEISDLANDFDMMAERIESLMIMHRQLLGDISHELRSPLTRLYLALELARRQCGPKAERELDRIEKEATSLNELIGQILILTRIENSIEAIHMSPFNLCELVAEIAANADFEAHGVNRAVHFEGDLSCEIKGNRELLKRAIENVIRNAIRYTPEATTVRVDMKVHLPAKSTKNFIEITVRDSGPGVPDAELQNIFRPFYRVSDARERQTGGVGLGLAITDRAVRLHNGAVTAANDVNGGFIVTISLPSDKLS
jgi:two-component system sensor histidine kinase CpxA